MIDKIYIPTVGRGDKQITWENLPQKWRDITIMVIQEKEKHLYDYDCEYLCIENPVSIISSKIKKPSQYIQPYEFGHAMSKKTCLWLRNLPKLEGTDNVYDRVEWENYDSGKRMCKWYSHDKKNRDKTFQNIANAIADQWSKYLKNDIRKLKDIFDQAINHYCLIDQCYYYDEIKLTELYMQFLNCDYIEAVEFIYHNIICYKNNKNYPKVIEYGEYNE